jgi:hypothetical protein
MRKKLEKKEVEEKYEDADEKTITIVMIPTQL